MNLKDFCDWILSEEGWKSDLEQLKKLLVLKDFSTLRDINPGLLIYKPDWPRLMLSASALSQSEEREHLEAALLIAQAGILISDNKVVANSSLIVLNQLYNQRTVNEAIQKGFITQGYLSRLGLTARMLAFKEDIESKIFSSISEPIVANKFQKEFWNSVDDSNWLYALAPTASGKSYIVLKYILEQLALKKANTVIYVAPTRALVTEVELNFRSIANQMGLADLSISSVPLKDLSLNDSQCIYVFTQERLHIFLNTLEKTQLLDILVVDEVQKLSDGMRGVILQDAIERIQRFNEKTKIIYLSPNAENPDYLFRDAPGNIITKIVDRDQPMVSQNMLWASQNTDEGASTEWKLELRQNESNHFLGNFDIVERPMTIAKKMALIAVGLAGQNSGNMVYANEPAEAESIAEFIAELIQPDEKETLNSLSALARDGVHRNFKLVNTSKKGVAFHYGNMPSLLREEIEDLFNKGDIRFLVCTSTLIEGVNLSCKTIYVQGPRKGHTTPMQDQDFWNLAGRAGRWGKEFQGNIVCIDPNVWKNKPPQRTKFVLKRQTDVVLNDRNGLLAYVATRSFDSRTINENGGLESVLAYLIGTNIRDNGLTTPQLGNNYPADYIETLNDSLNELKANIDIPQAIIEKHSGISAISMQTLLNYFRQSYVEGKKDILRLIPLTPEADGAYDNMEGILRRIHLKLSPSFGFGQQYKHYAVLILNWMQGHTLKRIIESNIKADQESAQRRKKQPTNIHTVIRNTMKEVEEFARFKAPKYISCYTDILKLFLAETNRLKLYPTDYPFDLFLEFGVMSNTLLSLVGLGLSRMTATELGNVILASELNKEQVLDWLKENVEGKDLPAFAKREVLKKLNI